MIDKIYLLLDNVRSTQNVGSILRTADGLGIDSVYLCGYTPYPIMPEGTDSRLPHLAASINRRIHKTALGAELTQRWYNNDSTVETISKLRDRTTIIAALEQSSRSVDLRSYRPDPQTNNLCLIVGNELDGISEDILKMCDICLEIKMSGAKESFNVSVAAAIALYQLKNML